jgi:DNA-binding transcriptional ArsR family regulator
MAPTTLVKAVRAVSCPVRLEILRYLEDPDVHFRPQADGDLARDGVCAGDLQKKVGVAPATASRHLALLADAGLLIATRRKGFTFYRRDEKAIRTFLARFELQLRTGRGV